jgi:hypothetical protein
MNKQLLFEFLDGCGLGRGLHARPDGASQSALVGIAVTPESEIVFDTVEKSRKFGNIARDPRVAFAIGWQVKSLCNMKASQGGFLQLNWVHITILIFENSPMAQPD